MELGDAFFATIELLPEPLLLVTVEGTILAVNTALLKHLDLPRQRLVERPLVELTEGPGSGVLEYLTRCARSGQLLLGALTLRRRDGTALKFRAGGSGFLHASQTGGQRAVFLRLVPSSEGISAFIALNDTIHTLNGEIARRRAIETALRQERETLQVTLASIGDAVIVTDAAGTVTFLNGVAGSLLGRPLELACGRALSDVFRIVDEHTQEPLMDPLQQVLRAGSAAGVAGHTVLLRADGSGIPIDHSAAPIVLEGKVIGAVLIFRDITERRKSEQALQDADRRKDEFLATLAHELRNPLAPIRNAMQLMAGANGDEARMASLRSMVERQLKHMVRLIDDLMDVSRITQGRLELRKERVDLDAVLQIAIETSLPLLQAKGHTLHVNSGAERIQLDADVTRLAQVFSNLLNNSAKYSPPGSEVSVTTRRHGDQVSIAFSDTGMGIPPTMLGRVFDLFVQLDRPGGHEGLGIGLTLVKRIIELHGGTVDAASGGEGRGTTFHVHLAAVQSATDAHPVDAVSTATAATLPARILVADDNVDAAQTLALLLEIEGHQVRTAHDGLEAIQVAENFRPQIALLDIGMPRLDGYQTARRIRDLAWARTVVLIAVTGWGQEQDLRMAAESGFDRHLVKPVDPLALTRMIGQMAGFCPADGRPESEFRPQCVGNRP